MSWWIRALSVSTAACLGGCVPSVGGAAMLRTPATEQCHKAELKECDALVYGVMLYVEGNKDDGEAAIKGALASNSPEGMRAYASHVRTLAKLPGLDTKKEVLAEIAALMEGPAVKRAAEQGFAQASAGAPTAASATSGGSVAAGQQERVALADAPESRRTDTVTLVGNVRAFACNPLAGGDASPNDGVCVRTARGELVVTDVIATGGCPSDLVVLSASEAEPDWFLQINAGSSLLVQGARLLVPAGSVMQIGMRNKGGTPQLDVRCSVTWSGYTLQTTRWSSASRQ